MRAAHDSPEEEDYFFSDSGATGSAGRTVVAWRWVLFTLSMLLSSALLNHCAIQPLFQANATAPTIAITTISFPMAAGYPTPSSSTSNTSVAFGGITPPAPREP